MKMYIFEQMDIERGVGNSEMFVDMNEALKAGKRYYGHLTEIEKKCYDVCRVYEIAATQEQIDAIQDGIINPAELWTADIWNALKEV